MMLLKPLKKRITVLAGCGHTTHLCDKITVISKDGEKKETEITISTIKPTHCHKCFEKMAIRCAWCGDYILPGDPITLYSPIKEGSFDIPKYAVVYKKDPLQLVGCLRMGCADTGGDRAGFWIIPGKVQRVLSPIEEVFMTGETVINSDLGDIDQAKPITD